MPRRIDHDGRRRRIADAVCLLADERGLEGVTLRDVAARAEVSMGAVQRCFRTKEEVLVFALAHVGERITDRVRARLAASPARSARTSLRHTLAEVSLLAEEHRAEARVWLAFVAQAAVTPALATVVRGSYDELRALLVRLIAEAVDPPHPEREADALLALADGLTTHVLIGRLSPEAALEILDDRLTRLGESERPGTRRR
ncbi:TetR/AcrR family transcriptional regulator [Streptomyces megasporus]|uniref:TetR/AcrR family transcriptional regulator n=1 Tax=Streptomyces megasporus TaxID=44060 RepID=UPI0004E21CFB|nr:TetR/AcrR family transcriptional regulator [Streptomyces megasporus]